jgi:hypothetical protein
MIEESALPEVVARSRPFDRPSKNPLQSSNPLAQFNVMWQCHKQVQVIRQNHVAPNGDGEIVPRSFAEFHKCFVNTIVCKMRPASVRAAGDEIERVAREDNIEPTWCPREFCHDLV